MRKSEMKREPIVFCVLNQKIEFLSNLPLEILLICRPNNMTSLEYVKHIRDTVTNLENSDKDFAFCEIDDEFDISCLNKLAISHIVIDKVIDYTVYNEYAKMNIRGI